jgi:hypothetical protein
MPAVARILSRYERGELAAFVSVAIDLLDVLDGDADIEDATNLEDDHTLTSNAVRYASGRPGCSISDPDENDLEDRCQAGDDGCAPVCVTGGVYWGTCEEDGDCEAWFQPTNLSPVPE